jgi:hypothetical protein
MKAIETTTAYIARGGYHMVNAAAEILRTNDYTAIRINDLAIAIVRDFHGDEIGASLAVDRAIKGIRRDLNTMQHADLVSTIERMANGTADDAAWTYEFYTLED